MLFRQAGEPSPQPSPKTLTSRSGGAALNRVKWAAIINLSPDSFSGDGAGHSGSSDSATADRLETLINAPLDWLDVGAVSTRPGSIPISVDEEWRRLGYAIPALLAFKERRAAMGQPVRISLDTSSPTIAQRAAAMGFVDIINDVWAGRKQEGGLSTIDVAAHYKCGLILMHMQGEPGTMQHQPAYRNCIEEVADFLTHRWKAARAAGVSEIYLDPGIGFGKTLEHNLALLSREGLASLRAIAPSPAEAPGLMIGLSRKRFLRDLGLKVSAAPEPRTLSSSSNPDALDLDNPTHRDFVTKVWEQRCIDHVESLVKDGMPTVLVVRTHSLPHEVAATKRFERFLDRP